MTMLMGQRAVSKTAQRRDLKRIIGKAGTGASLYPADAAVAAAIVDDQRDHVGGVRVAQRGDSRIGRHPVQIRVYVTGIVMRDFLRVSQNEAADHVAVNKS